MRKNIVRYKHSAFGFPDFKRSAKGFTLAELLIALAILGVIATFTIPKVLQSQQDGRYNAIAKEVASMMTGAYDAYKLKNTATAATKIEDLTPYMNYVAVDTVSIVDETPNSPYGASTAPCNTGALCLRLHNGGVLDSDPGAFFDGTATTNSIWFEVDPDGKLSSVKAVGFNLYFNGRITTTGACLPNTTASWGGTNHQMLGACPYTTSDPSWFSWN